ncbi:DUF3329 domain-containing protein [Rhizobium deserti]|nr:DUF3329 domain-containing protein [Rhizobium deserti]
MTWPDNAPQEIRTMIDANHPFYRPLWRRLMIPIVCLIWVCFELYAGGPIWAAMVGAVGLYATYKLFIEKPKAAAQERADERLE